VLRTGPNRLDERVVLTQVGPGGVAPSLYDFNPATGGGITLIKAGTGVLQIGGDNTTPIPVYGGAPASQGIKTVTGGVLRFMMGTSYGLTGGVASPVNLTGVPAVPATPVSAAMGVGFDPGAMPANLNTTGGIPGQSARTTSTWWGMRRGSFRRGCPQCAGGRDGAAPGFERPSARRVGPSGCMRRPGFITLAAAAER
jgi:hypothetical protein